MRVAGNAKAQRGELMRMNRGFEQGPIRPPSEANSLLLRLTRNCPWNRCTFCSVYKKKEFSLRPVEDVLRDIDAVYRYIGELQNMAEGDTGANRPFPEDEQAFFAARNWLDGGMKSVFLQDADSLVMKPEDLIAVLRHIKTRFPMVQRVTSYARSVTVARISDAALREMADAGLNRIHIGLETASDKILGMIKKGVTKEIHIKAGLKARKAGIELSEYVLTGIGGRQFSQEHSLETADALNQINPDFIRFRTLHILDTLKLFESAQDCRWEQASDLVLAREILLLIEKLENITSHIKSDHMLNLFQEIDGTLPQDKDRLMGILQGFIEMHPAQQALFQVGKRFGYFLKLSDMQIPGRLAHAEEMCRRLGVAPENVDEKIIELTQARMRSGLGM
jgi:radical SAM superfamily enzyme YgiQ (UPF0313 family)